MGESNEPDDLLQRAQKICSGREYCISDIMSLLDRWGAFTYSQWGKVKITLGLKSKNIPAEAISSGLEAIDDGEYLALLRKILDDQQKRIKAKNRYDLKGKLLRHALGKGFESHLVYDVINSMFSD
jgi:hypothetical protein